MSLLEWIKHFKYRWPAINSILRDGTVLYNVDLDCGTVMLNRSNSTVMNCRFHRGDGPAMILDGSNSSNCTDNAATT